jgi:hypothetical protein
MAENGTYLYIYYFKYVWKKKYIFSLKRLFPKKKVRLANYHWRIFITCVYVLNNIRSTLVSKIYNLVYVLWHYTGNT